jgi:hypothetical protein
LKRLMTRLVPEYRPGIAPTDRDKPPVVPQNRTDPVEARQLLPNPGYSGFAAASRIMSHQP